MKHQIVIVGGGTAGLAAAASLLKRKRKLDIAVIEPKEDHCYQPGWTMVGGGIFKYADTVRPEAAVMPKGVTWIRKAATAFEPEANAVVLDDGTRVEYDFLVAAPGIKLNFAAIRGLEETLGRNGVTSNYQPGLSPTTWKLVQETKRGKAIFTQPPPPFKCAGAPQKVMYLSCDAWRRAGVLKDIEVSFCTAAPSLFGVADYVPALMDYVKSYGVKLNLSSTLVAVEGAARKAVFREKDAAGAETEIVCDFDFLHVSPPQIAADVVRQSPLADAAGWVDVDPGTLRHKRYANIFALGDACNTPNAKTAAAARKQAPIVAENLLAATAGMPPPYVYDGYGSCPLTVERGKVVLAEFGYGGKLLPTFPKWLNDGTRPSELAWLLKARLLPWVYWNLIFQGHEWFAGPSNRNPAA
ncbi:MAG: FAD/NAD(P)-binding oxidoreductase [Parvularculaceae bacterium]|nr:FAD/NAD(P)-binding oxidoreductase [Parvularculaceae bacterium]